MMNRRNAGALDGKKCSNKGRACDAAAGRRKDAEGKVPRPVSKNILTKSMKILGGKKALAVRVNGVVEPEPAAAEVRPVAIVQPQVKVTMQPIGAEERDGASADGPYFDVDIADRSNPQLCAEYVKEIYQ